MGEKRKIEVSIKGGMQDETDPAVAQPGVCELLKNVEYIADALYARQAFPCDYLVPGEIPLGLFVWDDRANQIIRMMAISDIAGEGGGGKLLVKDASGGETWSAIGALGNVDAYVVASFANYRGVVYFCLGDANTPPTTFYYDGVTLRRGTNVPGLTARLVAVFGERIYYGNLQQVITNELTLSPLSGSHPYDPALWTLTNVAVMKAVVTVSGRTATVWRAAPTNATTAKMELAGALNLTNSTDPTRFQLLVMLAGVDATYRMPMTISLIFRGLPWEASRGYVLGVRRHPVAPNGFVYVCSQAGTSGAGEPVWPTTVGTEVADNTAKWKCESSDVIVSQRIEVPSTSDSLDPMIVYIPGIVPPVVGNYTLMLRYAFGTTSTPSVSLLPIAFGMDDGQADGTPVYLKKNFGQQLTRGSYEFRFTAASPGTFPLVDVGAWTEPGQPDVILAQNSVLLLEETGPLTALIVAGGRLWWFKRRAAWAYTLTTNPDFPILREKVYSDIGAIGSKALDTLDDFLFVIAEYQIYGFNAARTSLIEPAIERVGLCPEGIRQTVMGHGPTWVENIPSVNGQKFGALLRVHPVRKQLWIHTQDRRIFIYDIVGGEASASETGRSAEFKDRRWTFFDIPKSGGANARIRDIEWNPTTNRMMVITENGIGRQAHREEQGSVAAIAVTAPGSGYATPPTVTIAAPPAGGTQATATATVAAGLLTVVTVTNAGSGYLVAPGVTFSGGGGTGAAASSRLTVQDSDASGNVLPVTKTIQPRPFEVRPERPVMTVEDVALYGKIPMSQVNSTCEVDISFDGGASFTFFTRVRLSPLSTKKRRYPIPVRKTGESVVISVSHTGDTGNDVFNVLDVDANVIVRGVEQPRTRPTPVAKNT